MIQVQQNLSQSFKKRLIFLLAVVFMLIAVIVTQSLLARGNFRITAVNPKLSEVSYIAPYLKVSFNTPVDADKVIIEDPDSIIDEITSSGFVVTMKFKSDLQIDRRYALKFTSVENSEGEKINNYDLSFVAKDISYDKLPDDQKKTLDTIQKDKPYSIDFIDFANFDELTDNGMTTDQLLNLKQWLVDYSNSVKREYRQMKLDPNSLVFAPYDPEAEEPIQKADFVLSLGDEKLKAHIEYDPTYDAVDLQLFSEAGIEKYDSVGHQD